MLLTSEVLFQISPGGLGPWMNDLNTPLTVYCEPSNPLFTFVVTHLQNGPVLSM